MTVYVTIPLPSKELLASLPRLLPLSVVGMFVCKCYCSYCNDLKRSESTPVDEQDQLKLISNSPIIPVYKRDNRHLPRWLVI